MLVTGLNALGLQIIQGYVDNTSDVQTAAALFCSISPARWHYVPSLSDRRSAHAQHSQAAANQTDLVRAEKWFETYRELLDSWKLFHHRVHFDMLRGDVIANSIRRGEVAHHEWVPRQLEVRCNYCNKIVTSSAPMALSPVGESGWDGGVDGPSPPGGISIGASSLSAQNPMTAPPPTQRVQVCFFDYVDDASIHDIAIQTDLCPICHRRLPRCSICLMSIGIPDDDIRNLELSEIPGKGGTVGFSIQVRWRMTFHHADTANDAMVFCQTCRHGGHSGHILDWFLGPNGDGNGHEVCPVADCDCRCSTF